MQLSKNFTFEEMTRTDVRELLETNRTMAQNEPVISNLKRVCNELLEPIRTLFKLPIQVNSGYRYPVLNERIGGSKTSQHVKGEAADIVIKGYETQEKQIEAVKKIAAMKNFTFQQLLIESGCIHISLGSKREIAYYDVATKQKIKFIG